MNLANAKVGQLLIPIDDFEKGVAFYRDILGLPFLFAAPPQMAFFNCGAFGFSLASPHRVRSRKEARRSTFKFQTSMPYFHP